MTTTSTSLFNRSINWLAYVTIIYSSIPNRVFAHVRYGEDPSWQFALNTAIKNHYEFGTDFIFTYGPLGYLATALPLYVYGHGLMIILYKLILFCCLTYVGIIAYNHSDQTYEKFFVVIAYVFAGRLYYFESSVYFLMFFLLSLLWHQYYKKDGYLYACFIFACINLFIKLNTGFILFGLLGVYSLSQVLRQKTSFVKIGILWSGSAVLILLIAWHSRTNFFNYVLHGEEIVSNYTLAQTVNVKIASVGFVTAIAIMILFLISFLSPIIRSPGNVQYWSNAVLVGLAVFVVYKQAFIRGSDNHQIAFFGSVCIVTIGLFSLYKLDSNNNGWSVFTLIAVITLACVAIVNIGVFSFLNRPLKDLYAKEPDPHIPISRNILKTIGQASIDILPFEAMHLYYNGMNYTPRPIPQGYQAYSEKLDSMNAAYYQGNKAPQFVLLSNGSIDNRPPFWDEFQTKLTIRANYTVTDSLLLPDRPGQEPTLYWLLQRKAVLRQSTVIETGGPWQQSITEPIDCRAFSPASLLKIKLEPNLPGQLRAFLFQPAILKCHIQYTDGQQSEYDAITPILAAGVPVGRQLEKNEDISAFIRNQDPPPANRIQKIWFTGNTSLFKKQMTLQVLTEKEE